MNSTTSRRTHLATMVALLGTSFLLNHEATAQTTLTWSGGTGGSGTAWATNTNWATSAVPGSNTVATNNDIAAFGATGTGTQMQMNFGTLGSPFYLGTINLLSTNTVAKTMGANTATAGIVQLNGTGANNLILSNASTSLFTLAPLAGGSGTGMSLRLNASNSEIANVGGITISAPITETSGGAKGITKTGSGTLTLSGANTFTGAVRLFEGGLSLTTVSGGSALGTSAATLQIGNSSASTNATVTLTGGTTSYSQAITVEGTGGTKQVTSNNSSGYTFSGGLTLNDSFTIQRAGSGTANTTFSSGGISIATGKTLTLQTTSTSGIVLNSVISGAGSLNVNSTGAGTSTLSGANTFTGGVALNAGTLLAFTGGTSGTHLGTGSLTFGTTAATWNVNTNADATISNNIVLGAPLAATNFTILKNSASLSTGTVLDLTGNISGGNSNSTLFFNSNTSSDNTTRYRLSGNNSTLAGTININRGVLEVNNTNALGTAAVRLDSNTNNTIGNLSFRVTGSFNNPVTITSAGAYPIGVTTGNTATLGSTVNAAAQFQKVDAGTLVLTGTSSLLTGSTGTPGVNVSGGILQVGSGGTTGTLGTGISVVNLGTGATLAFNRSDAITQSGIIQGSGALTKSGTGTLTLSGANTFTGGTTLSGGGLSLGNNTALGTSSLNVTAVSTSISVTSTSATLANNIMLPNIAGRVTFVTPNSSLTTLNGTISGGSPSTSTTSVTGTEFFFQGGTSGSNTGQLILNGDNSGMQGTINVQRGPLRLGHANAAGSTLLFLDSNLPPAGVIQLLGNFTVANNVRINSGAVNAIGVDGSVSATLSGVISSNGALGINKVGTGTLTLVGANTYSGTTTISAGTLIANHSSAIGNGSLTNTLIFNGGILQASGVITSPTTRGVTMTGVGTIDTNGNPISIAGVITGAGDLNKIGANTLTLSGANSYSGTTTVNAGTLIVTGSLASNLASSNFIAAPDDSLVGNPLLTRRIVEGGSYSNFGSTSTGDLNSTAELLAGVVVGAVTPGDNADVSMKWRTRTAAETTGASSPTLMSNVLDLEGVAIVSGLERDLFVLQLSYDASAAIAAPSDIYLATFDTNSNAWVKAVARNAAGTNNATLAQQGYLGSFAQFQIDNPGALSNYVGAYGVDPVANKVWAVLNHNSEFAVIPEPGTLVTGGLAMLGLGYAGLRRRRKQN